MQSLALLLALAATLGSVNATHFKRLRGVHLGTAKRVIVQMFGWNWDSYGFVSRLSVVDGLQPVSYTLTSKRGNRQQFQNRLAWFTACHNAGVGVIADTIWNHMTGMDSGTGVAGSSFTHYVYPGTYQYQDFHHCGLTSNDDISDYSNRAQVQTCELVNLADLATDTEYVRGRLAQLDASKRTALHPLRPEMVLTSIHRHRRRRPLQTLSADFPGKPYITQEVIFGSGEPVTPNEYTGNGDVQEFRYTSTIKDAFLNGNIAALQNLDNRGWVSGTSANVFVANHDTERGDSSLNINSPRNSFILGTIFSLAHPYGTPTVLSGFTFTNSDDGAPNNGAGTCSTTGGSGGWRCEHRYVAFSGMVRFRNAAGSNALSNWYSPSQDRIAFGRGSAAFVAINNRDDAWSYTFQTALPAGSYCDAITGKPNGSGGCTGAVYTVSSSGTFTASVYPRSAVALYNDSNIALCDNQGQSYALRSAAMAVTETAAER
ncbi:glycoside hydrolase superfamily [Ephemerocybe angulata]|uniref:alpha-amylase n=1 Tax=Ephemerocybe angulata TaxID=980116 RepID=A0A8H6HE45_9AGAR|nr:glycoside hydrolase superfamily [Tulosesus angulatus]